MQENAEKSKLRGLLFLHINTLNFKLFERRERWKE